MVKLWAADSFPGTVHYHKETFLPVRP
jgi:hypothetical protein